MSDSKKEAGIVLLKQRSVSVHVAIALKCRITTSLIFKILYLTLSLTIKCKEDSLMDQSKENDLASLQRSSMVSKDLVIIDENDT